MPTTKNRMQYLLDNTYYLKFLYIMEQEKRKSESAMSGYIVEKYIDDYEAANGPIEVDD